MKFGNISGLFQSVILQSGAAISFWSVMSPLWRQEYDKRFQVFLNDIQCNFNDSKLIKSCLKQKTVKEIQDGQFKVKLKHFCILEPGPEVIKHFYAQLKLSLGYVQWALYLILRGAAAHHQLN